MRYLNSDTIYFKSKVAPGNQDWVHCKVLYRGNGVVRCEVIIGGQASILDFALSDVQRICYGVDA